MTQISTSLDSKEVSRLDALATRLHVSRAAAMRVLVIGALKNIETAGLDNLIGEPDNWPVGPVYDIPRPDYDHPGIRLQIVCPAGPLVDANSDHLYFVAKYGGRATECYISCPPNCREHGWYELFPGEGMTYQNSREIQVWIRPERLTDTHEDRDTMTMTTGPHPAPEPAEPAEVWQEGESDPATLTLVPDPGQEGSPVDPQEPPDGPDGNAAGSDQEPTA
jgi:hypothetical protein